MARVTQREIQGWLELTKLNLAALNTDLLEQLEEEVLVQLSSVYSIASWADETTTPKIVRTIIAKMYASWYIDKIYSENQDEGNDYAARLLANANMLLQGLISGLFEIPGTPATNPGTASFYPTDASSAQQPTEEDPSLGPARFSLGKVF